MLEPGANPASLPPQPQNKISLPFLSTNNNPQGATSIVLFNNEGQNADTEMVQHDNYQPVSVTANLGGEMTLD